MIDPSFISAAQDPGGRHRMTPSNKLYLILALTILIWGNSFVVVKVAIDDGASPTLIAMARFIVASSIFGGYLIWKRPSGVDRGDLKAFLFLAFIGVGVYYIFQYYGVKFAGPAISAILVTLLSDYDIPDVSLPSGGKAGLGTEGGPGGVCCRLIHGHHGRQSVVHIRLVVIGGWIVRGRVRSVLGDLHC